MSNWSDFNRLDTLKVSFLDSSTAKSAAIFANGRNQVQIIVQVKILGRDNKPLDFTAAQLVKQLRLVNYSSGSTLSSSWSSSSVSQGYEGAYQYSPTRDSDEGEQVPSSETRDDFVILYVSSTTTSIETDIAVEIDIPNVGKFSTTANGTSTINAPAGSNGSVFRSPSYVHVSAIKPLNYSEGADHFIVDGMPKTFSDLQTVVSDMGISTQPFGTVAVTYNGTSSKKIVNISLRPDKLYIKNITTNGGTVKQGWTFDGNGYADVVYGANGNNYDTVFLFVNKYVNGLMPGNYICLKRTGTTRYYNIGHYDARHIIYSTPKSNNIQVVISNHRVPNVNGLYHQYGWYDQPEQSITIYDNFGNMSTIKIKVNDDSWPGFLINDVKVN